MIKIEAYEWDSHHFHHDINMTTTINRIEAHTNAMIENGWKLIDQKHVIHPSDKTFTIHYYEK